MRGLIGSSRCGQRGTLGYLTGLFEFTELFLGLFELFLESRVGVQTGHGDRTCDTSGIDIALGVNWRQQEPPNLPRHNGASIS